MTVNRLKQQGKDNWCKRTKVHMTREIGNRSADKPYFDFIKKGPLNPEQKKVGKETNSIENSKMRL